jgi:hypothetical protein
LRRYLKFSYACGLLTTETHLLSDKELLRKEFAPRSHFSTHIIMLCQKFRTLVATFHTSFPYTSCLLHSVWKAFIDFRMECDYKEINISYSGLWVINFFYIQIRACNTQKFLVGSDRCLIAWRKMVLHYKVRVPSNCFLVEFRKLYYAFVNVNKLRYQASDTCLSLPLIIIILVAGIPEITWIPFYSLWLWQDESTLQWITHKEDKSCNCAY